MRQPGGPLLAGVLYVNNSLQITQEGIVAEPLPDVQLTKHTSHNAKIYYIHSVLSDWPWGLHTSSGATAILTVMSQPHQHCSGHMSSDRFVSPLPQCRWFAHTKVCILKM
jgi:hypothetical protein